MTREEEREERIDTYRRTRERFSTIYGVCREVERLEKVHDAFLAALTEIEELTAYNGRSMREEQAWNIARAAIAKARGVSS